MRSVTQEHSAAPPTTRDLEQPAADAPASTPVIWDDEETDALLEHRRIVGSQPREQLSDLTGFVEAKTEMQELRHRADLPAGRRDLVRPGNVGC
jgi:hypothetical protein